MKMKLFVGLAWAAAGLLSAPAAAWTAGRSRPVTLEGGLFNGSGLTNQKNFWTGGYNFALKGRTVVGRRLNITLSCQKSRAGGTGTMIYDAGTYWSL